VACGSISRLGIIVINAAFVSGTFSAFAKGQNRFDRHDVSGVWWVQAPGPDTLLERGKKGDASKCETCHISEHAAPEPPLTPWAISHLMIPRPVSMPSPADTCDPIGVPAQYWFTQLYPFEFVVTPERIFQFFEKQYEWREIRMNGTHPEHVHPSYMGDAVGKWEGSTLVIDTVGFDGREMEPVGVNHRMSPAFHLIERWQRVSATELELDATYYDELAWGRKPWASLKKTFLLQPNMKLFESLCSPSENKKFGDRFLNPSVVPNRSPHR
jgi:hypothetical protein